MAPTKEPKHQRKAGEDLEHMPPDLLEAQVQEAQALEADVLEEKKPADVERDEGEEWEH